MQHIDGLYTQFANWRHGTTGHVLEGRYTGIVIDDTCYLRNAIGYVLRNPVAAGLVRDAGDWRWSTYNAAMGKASPRFETLTWIRAHVVHGYLLTEIANYLELHPTTISRIVNQTGSYRLTRD